VTSAILCDVDVTPFLFFQVKAIFAALQTSAQPRAESLNLYLYAQNTASMAKQKKEEEVALNK
jgi:hypothetical protein